MKDSIKKYFKVGLVQFMAFPAALRGEDPDIVANIKKVACDDYFDTIEITWIKDAGLRAKVKALLEGAHMEICYGAQPRLLTTGLSPNSLDEDQRLKAQASLIEAIDEAHEMGAI